MIHPITNALRPKPVERIFTKEGRSHHVFIAQETPDGVFCTHDRTVYQRDQQTGTIRRVTPKAKGKAARRAEKAARRQQLAAIAKSYTEPQART